LKVLIKIEISKNKNKNEKHNLAIKQHSMHETKYPLSQDVVHLHLRITHACLPCYSLRIANGIQERSVYSSSQRLNTDGIIHGRFLRVWIK